jgi:NAD(P)-dependent dehydrogenase (short-subunit alcohol dehydrogenase family)
MRPPSVFRPGLFSERVAVVTGGGTGIGYAIAEELGALGARVVIAARDETRLHRAAERLRAAGVDALPIPCNVRDESQVAALMRRTVEERGRLDFLVNNAGGQFPSPAAQIRGKGWNAVIETNLTGTFTCCREAFAAWMEEHGGGIVNIIADMWRGFPGMAHTGAARAGVDNLTKSLAVEWAWRGVRVNSVAPGIVLSSGYNRYDPFFRQVFLAMKDDVPARRLGTVEEVSAAVCFLLSPGAAYITGETLRVDGAGSLWRSHWQVPEHAAMPPYGDLEVPEPEGESEREAPRGGGA